MVYVIGEFVIGLFYFVVFEMLTGGRSPGKRLVHLRVLRATGEPIDLQSSVIRNLMRLIDGATLVYLPSIVCVAVTRRHQRPGDLAAGTIVTREQPGPRKPGESRLGGRRRGGGRGRREKRQRARRELWGAVPQPGGDPAAGRWDASAVTAEEMAAVRRFLERRETIDDAARRELATRLTGGLWPKVTGAPPGIEAERFLEELEQIKRAR